MEEATVITDIKNNNSGSVPVDLDFSINRDVLLKPLQFIVGAIDKKQALPILSCILFELSEGVLSLTGTDLELELVQQIKLVDQSVTGALAIPAKKLYDICRALAPEADIRFTLQANQLIIRSGRSRFVLTLIVSKDFPSIEKKEKLLFSCALPRQTLCYLIEKTSFSMAHQDVRYFLNGLLLELRNQQCTAVATDGHRLSTVTKSVDLTIPDHSDCFNVLIPRKAVAELAKLLDADDSELIELQLAENYMGVTTSEFSFTTKLIDGQYPDYRGLIPRSNEESLAIIDKEALREVVSRVAILSNDKCRGAWLYFDQNKLMLRANNPDKDQAEDELLINYSGPELKIGCNLTYLLDVIAVMDSDQLIIQLGGAAADNSVLVYSAENPDDRYVIMLMCL